MVREALAAIAAQAVAAGAMLLIELLPVPVVAGNCLACTAWLDRLDGLGCYEIAGLLFQIALVSGGLIANNFCLLQCDKGPMTLL